MDTSVICEGQGYMKVVSSSFPFWVPPDLVPSMLTLPLNQRNSLTCPHKPTVTTLGMKRGDHLYFYLMTKVSDALNYKNKIPPTFGLKAVNKQKRSFL